MSLFISIYSMDKWKHVAKYYVYYLQNDMAQFFWYCRAAKATLWLVRHFHVPCSKKISHCSCWEPDHILAAILSWACSVLKSLSTFLLATAVERPRGYKALLAHRTSWMIQKEHVQKSGGEKKQNQKEKNEVTWFEDTSACSQNRQKKKKKNK